MKTASLIMLLSGHRVNTLLNLKITNMYISETECTFVFSSVLKHSRLCYHQQPLIFRPFPSNPSHCPVTNIKQYILHNNCPTIQTMLKRYYCKMDQRNLISRWNKQWNIPDLQSSLSFYVISLVQRSKLKHNFKSCKLDRKFDF